MEGEILSHWIHKRGVKLLFPSKITRQLFLGVFEVLAV